ncbi:hypothetical protein KY385_04330 [Candidatus Parcubacteria bacterium]|nr:hypothetical protein [Candidatus Parcubacteria bacterium]
MSWNYRIIRHDAGNEQYLAIHEVFYSEKGEIESWTSEPIDIIGENRQEIIGTIENMLKDCKKQPVLSEAKLIESTSSKNHG